MKTKTIGQILKEERTFHHLDIAEVAKRTRIKPEYLEALEANQFDALPAATFVKGYIRAYGQLFGFDHNPLIALLRRDFKESGKGKLVPREFIKPVLKTKNVWTPVTWTVVGLGAALAVVFTYVAVQWYNFTKPPTLTVFSPEPNEVVSAQVQVRGETAPDAIVLVNSQPVALQPDGSFNTEVYVPREGISSITVEAKDRRGKISLVQRAVYVRF
jgi:cytoskeletal protein RodZ